jgi:hypothetical protein
LEAGSGIGSSANAIATAAAGIAARAGAAGMFISNDRSFAIDSVGAIPVARVQVDGTIFVTQVLDDLVGMRTTNNGRLIVLASAGTIGVLQAVVAHGTGRVLVSAALGAVDLQAPVQSGSGPISLLAGLGISQGAAADLSTVGSIDVEAFGASVTMADGATASGGIVRYKASQNVILGGLSAAGGAGPVSVVECRKWHRRPCGAPGHLRVRCGPGQRRRGRVYG